MFIIDFKDETIKEVDEMEICMFVNGLIKDKDDDLLGKRYLFVPDAEAAKYIINKSIGGKYATKH